MPESVAWSRTHASTTCREIREEFVGEGGGEERDTRLRALRPTRPHTVGYVGVCDQEQGGIEWQGASRGAAPMCQELARNRYSSYFENNYVTELCSGSEAGSYLRLIDSCITRFKAQRPSRT